MTEEMVYIDENNELHKINTEFINSTCKRYDFMSMPSLLLIATSLAVIRPVKFEKQEV